MCSVFRDKRRVRKRCVALLISVVGKSRCGPRVSLRSDKFHRAVQISPGQVVLFLGDRIWGISRLFLAK